MKRMKSFKLVFFMLCFTLIAAAADDLDSQCSSKDIEEPLHCGPDECEDVVFFFRDEADLQSQLQEYFETFRSPSTEPKSSTTTTSTVKATSDSSTAAATAVTTSPATTPNTSTTAAMTTTNTTTAATTTTTTTTAATTTATSTTAATITTSKQNTVPCFQDCDNGAWSSVKTFVKTSERNGMVTHENSKVVCVCNGTSKKSYVVFQRRDQSDTSFATKSYDDYKKFFGDEKVNFWLGLNSLHILTTRYTLDMRVVVTYTKNSGNPREIKHKDFTAKNVTIMGEEHDYKMVFSFTDYELLRRMNNQNFTVEEPDNGPCPGKAGWWFHNIMNKGDEWCTPNSPIKNNAGKKGKRKKRSSHRRSKPSPPPTAEPCGTDSDGDKMKWSSCKYKSIEMRLEMP